MTDYPKNIEAEASVLLSVIQDYKSYAFDQTSGGGEKITDRERSGIRSSEQLFGFEIAKMRAADILGNLDGVVTLDETKALEGRADGNKDGKSTPEEIKQFFESKEFKDVMQQKGVDPSVISKPFSNVEVPGIY